MKRVLIKLSGESLAGKDGYGIDAERVDYYVEEIMKAVSMGTQIAIVIGGGNIFRGVKGATAGFDRVQGDYMGMMATIINSLALQTTLEEHGVKTKVLSGLPVERVAEAMSASRAIEYIESGNLVIIAGGSGNPFFTTDTAGVLRALEIKADAILKGTRVDGVYDKDPEKFDDARKYVSLSFDEAIAKSLKIMDQTAFTLCKENDLPIVVFNINVPSTLVRVLKGENAGTIVKNPKNQ